MGIFDNYTALKIAEGQEEVYREAALDASRQVESYRGKNLVDMSCAELIVVINELARRDAAHCEEISRYLSRPRRAQGFFERLGLL